MTLIPLLSRVTHNWIREYTGVFWAAFVIAMVVQCSLLCFKDAARRVPTNYGLLFLFTVCEGYMVAFICTQYPA